jgi:hypothetical protein
MSRRVCPELSASLSASRRADVGEPLPAHVESCPDCAPAVALDRALARVAASESAESFPSVGTIRLEILLAIERRRLARAAAVRVAVHALAFVVCVGLFVAAWVLEFRAGSSPTAAGATCGGALMVVAMSMWSLVRAVDEAALVS